MSKDNITDIGVKYKKPRAGGKMLNVVGRAERCHHASFLIHPDSGRVTCMVCNDEITPLAALIKLASKESLFYSNQERYRSEMQRLAERRKTKCQHCRQITHISRN